MGLQIELKNNSIKTIIIVLLIIFFISFRTANLESFITWYLPFYKSVNTIVPKYLIDNNTYSNLKYRYTDKIVFYFNDNDKLDKGLEKYYMFLFENILKNIFIEKLNILYKKTHIEQIKEVNNNKYHFSIVSSPLMFHLANEYGDQISTINFVTTISFEYLFLISTKSTGINKLSDIKNTRIGIGKKNMESYFIANDMFENMGWQRDQLDLYDYNVKDSFKKLLNNEIDCFFFTDFYPSGILNKYILNDFESQIVLIPFKGINNELFQLRHRYMDNITIDLNKLPSNYLPKKLGERNYTMYNPGFITYKYPKFIICNKFLDQKISYQIVESISRNLDIINSSEYVKENPQNYLNFSRMAFNFNNIPTHPGARIFYTSKSVFTQLSNKECIYYVGNLKCTDRRVEQARISENTT